VKSDGRKKIARAKITRENPAVAKRYWTQEAARWRSWTCLGGTITSSRNYLFTFFFFEVLEVEGRATNRRRHNNNNNNYGCDDRGELSDWQVVCGGGGVRFALEPAGALENEQKNDESTTQARRFAFVGLPTNRTPPVLSLYT